jgi:thiamine pyrophosphate-dependent acetolactate synthase large subunit-like protein
MATAIDRPDNIGNPQLRWGSDAVAETVRSLEVDYIALVPGASFRGFHDSIVNYLGNAEPQMVVCLHEEHAVAIADGYAKVTDRPMAVALHSNVGLMHASMAIFNAWCERNPMLIFGATGPLDAHKRRPWIEWIHTSSNQASIVRDYIKWDDTPGSAQAAVESVLRAWQICQTPPHGPVYVCLDVGMQEAEIEGEISFPPPERYAPARDIAATDEDIDRILDAFEKARFPVIMMGRLSPDREAYDARIALAEALDAVAMTSLHKRSSFPTTHPNHKLPISPERPGKAHADMIARADLILDLDWLDLGGYLRLASGDSQSQKPTDATVIKVSMDSTIAKGWSADYQALQAADINVVARPDTVVKQLLKRIEARGVKASRPDVAAMPHWTGSVTPPEASPAGEPMSLLEMAWVLAEFQKTRDVTYTRLPLGFPGAYCRFDGPIDYLGKDAGGAVGSGPGHAVGAALALRGSGRLPVAVMGDGDYLMGVNALWTASHMELPLMIVVANNRSYFNDEAHQERVADMRDRPPQNKWIGQRLDQPPVDIVAMATAQGFEGGEPITDADQLMAELEKGEKVLREGGRYVIDARRTGYEG